MTRPGIFEFEHDPLDTSAGRSCLKFNNVYLPSQFNAREHFKLFQLSKLIGQSLLRYSIRPRMQHIVCAQPQRTTMAFDSSQSEVRVFHSLLANTPFKRPKPHVNCPNEENFEAARKYTPPLPPSSRTDDVRQCVCECNRKID